MYDEAEGISIGSAYVTYIPGERCILFFNLESQHLGEWNDSPDDAAIAVAQRFLKLTQEAQK